MVLRRKSLENRVQMNLFSPHHLNHKQIWTIHIHHMTWHQFKFTIDPEQTMKTNSHSTWTKANIPVYNVKHSKYGEFNEKLTWCFSYTLVLRVETFHFLLLLVVRFVLICNLMCIFRNTITFRNFSFFTYTHTPTHEHKEKGEGGRDERKWRIVVMF